MKPTFFRTPAEFRRWLEAHHETASELVVGYYKKGTGKPSITWPESVDEALCFGWIDGIRRSIDGERYSIRFTPRRAKSGWSAVNIKRVAELTKRGLMMPAGLRAFAARDPKQSPHYSFEQRDAERALRVEYGSELAANRQGLAFFEAQPPYYRRTVSWWIMSAKKDETRRRRLATLIAACVDRRRLDLLSGT